ncbi:Nif3-like dinuclear metal center hexameric protein [Agrococcus sp. ARC_14]|uniref:Nif3-like dinuclear metal center hexameric protein n=1 Tax=Agrococcus sp. ARC_14 TaxID=2919927 RepID=UPI001F050DF7|nr:Nif3-like dinuclear metal center hexameric protein [Agrococcus sp. ARC_14]MCH1882984.1 Nif3-like dinuclear metal center hexameric protein [Agrococcus sp. ARC_14]
MTSVADVQLAVESLWPAATAEDWDAVGLVAGDPADPVRRILLAVDAVEATAAEAVERGADVLLVHHPLLLRGATSVAATTPAGRVITRLVRERIALLAAHTNADAVDRGTSGELASMLGLVDVSPIVVNRVDPEKGLGRVGELPQPVALGELVRRLAELVPAVAGGLRAAGHPSAQVRRVAICGGAGDSLLREPAVAGADVYITSDLRHHPASDARERHAAGEGPALIDVSHWASESLWLRPAAEQLRAALPGVEVEVSEIRTDPWDFAVPQEEQAWH